MTYELNCNYDSRNSFYGKANIRTEGKKTILKSYSTDVAYIENGIAVVNGMYSNTTTRHIKEFLKQKGFNGGSGSQMYNEYKATKEQINQESKEDKDKADSMLKSISMVVSMGEIFCDKKKDKNDWKLRMLKAGLENKGLSVPDDWDTLTEAEKEKRLNGVIAIAKGN